MMRFLEVFALGFFCGLIPGPVVTAIFMETIRVGWRQSKRIVFLAALGETVMSITCVLAASLLNAKSYFFSALSFFGALLLFSIAWDLWKTTQIQEDDPHFSKAPLFSKRRILFLALFNGMAWIFWVTVCTPEAVKLDAVISGGRWIFIALFEAGWISSTLGLAFLIEFFRTYFQTNSKLHLLYRTVSLFFLFFAFKLVYGSARLLLG